MTRLMPRTLFTQMILILLGGMLVSHLIGFWIYAGDRALAVRAVGGYAATQRIANLTRLIDEAPPDWRARIVSAANDPSMRVTLSAQTPALAVQPEEDDVPVRRYLAAQLPSGMADRVYVMVSPLSTPVEPFRHHMMAMMGPAGGAWPPPWMISPAPWRSLEAAVQLSDGNWLSFSAGLPPGGLSDSWYFLVSLAIMAIVVVLASAWGVRRITAPLGVLVAASNRLGRDVNAPPLVETGSREMRQAAQSFNQMQERIQRLLENRTRMLAALSHDLRTPLTLLRLRTEGLPESEDRDRMLATLDEADTMVSASLDFARDKTMAEPARPTDLGALIGAIVDDMADAGLPVTMTAAASVVVNCQPAALRRAVGNLVDNAVKYGGAARVAVETAQDAVRIVVDDDGPGIPDAELQRVFEPFHRVEQSRSRDTGGVGLGLAIALSIVQAHGGQITLTNRASDPAAAKHAGLRATIALPRAK